MPTTKFNLPTIASGQAQKEVSYNGAVNIIDALLVPRVLDRDLATPPTSPVNGSLYIVATGGTGAWATQDGKLALWQDGWQFFTPLNGTHVFIVDENAWLDYFNGVWQSPQNNAVVRFAPDGTARPSMQVGSNTASLYVGDGTATFVASTAYIGFNAARTASNTWTYQGDGTKNGGAIIDGRMDGALRVFIRSTAAGTTATETDATTLSNERMQIQRTLISMGGGLGSESVRVVTISSMVNRVELLGSVTTSPVVVRAGGTDTNIDVQIIPKGTGLFNLSLDTTNLVTTVGVAGAATALPANPVGYLRVKLNGTIRKIPYYND